MTLDEFKAWLDGFEAGRRSLDDDISMEIIIDKLATVEAKPKQFYGKSVVDALLALQANAEKIKNAEGFTPDPMFMVRAEANRLAEELKDGPLNKAIVHTINFLEDVIGGE